MYTALGWMNTPRLREHVSTTGNLIVGIKHLHITDLHEEWYTQYLLTFHTSARNIKNLIFSFNHSYTIAFFHRIYAYSVLNKRDEIKDRIFYLFFYNILDY